MYIYKKKLNICFLFHAILLNRSKSTFPSEQNEYHSKIRMLRYRPIYHARMLAEYDAIGYGSESEALKRQYEMNDNAPITTRLVLPCVM